MPHKTIVITGASGGIGAELARTFGRKGNRLVLAARRRDRLDVVARQAADFGASRVVVVEADVTKRADVQRISATAVDAFGGYDVWINNAGRGITRNVLDLSETDIDEMMAVNVKSALYGMQTAAAHFIDRGCGHIVNVSSFLGRVPLVPQRSAYSAAKAALNVLTANLRVDLHEEHPDVHVTLIMPGMVATEFGRNALGSAADTPIYAGSNVQKVEDVAEMIAGTIDRPVAELYTNSASAGMARRYFADVGAFEAQRRFQGAAPDAER